VNALGATEQRVLSAVRRLEGFAVSRADGVVSCSPGFVPYIVSLGADGARIEVIPNWVDTTEISRLPEPPVDDFVDFLYSGNLGYTQAFGTLFEAARRAGPGVRVVVAGAGNADDKVADLAQPPHLVRPVVPRDEYPRMLGSAHVLVIAQRAVAANANLPSKIASYLASGRPIAASIGLDTPAAELLRKSGAAIVVPPEDPGALADALARLRDDPALREQLGRSGRSFAVERLDRESVLPRLAGVVLGQTRSGRDG
jgi:glycosyltransferase involved in cell wall biosynthesis